MARSEGFGQSISERECRWRAYIAGTTGGNPEALALLYDESAAALLGLAVKMTKNKADAEEVILDVFEQVWRTAGHFDPTRGSAWRWLTVLVRSRALDHVRRASFRSDRALVSPICEQKDPVSHEPSPDRVSILNEERIFIRGALQGLPGEQRQALELAYFSGLTHVEIASELGVPLGTIKTRIRAGMEKLRISLSRGGLAEAAGTSG